MSNFNKIDLETYYRKEHFLHYMNEVPCFYSMTTNIDITEMNKYIKKEGYKFYPVIVYVITRIINRHKEFKMSLDQDNHLGYFTYVNPSYTIFHEDDQTFSSIWTKYDSCFEEFYKNYRQDIKKYGHIKGFSTKECLEDNMINISSIPWASFTGFHLSLPKGQNHLLPIITIGRYFEKDDKILLPLAIQVHHAVCDGFHVSRFINELQDFMIDIENHIYK